MINKNKRNASFYLLIDEHIIKKKRKTFNFLMLSRSEIGKEHRLQKSKKKILKNTIYLSWFE